DLGPRREEAVARGAREDEGDEEEGRDRNSHDRRSDGGGSRREAAAAGQREGPRDGPRTQEDAARIGAGEQGRVPARGRWVAGGEQTGVRADPGLRLVQLRLDAVVQRADLARQWPGRQRFRAALGP